MALSNAASGAAAALISPSQGSSASLFQQTSSATNLTATQQTTGASAAAAAGGGATNLIQQKAHLPNPFELSDPQILDIVYLTHVNDDEICDAKILFDLASNVIRQSYSQIPLVSYKPEFRTLKLISCQMIGTRNAPQCAHQTTLWILQHLRCYSWDAKALITLAAFSLEYGNLVHLLRVPTTDILGSSLKQLNQVQERKVSADITQLAEFIVQDAFQQIKQWAAWSAEGYDPEEVPALTGALQEIPAVIYWTIASIVASTGNLIGVSDYNLSKFRERLNVVVKKLREHLTSCDQEIGFIGNYLNCKKVFEKPKDIVDLLKALIYRNGTQGLQIYEGTVLVKTGIEVFKQKHVLLFISSLDSIGDEILLLNSVYDRLQEDPKELKGFRKDDFKILWIPIVDVWDEFRREQFRTWRNNIKWYAVEYFSELPGHRIIRDPGPEGLNYEGSPIIPVFNPQGKKTNKDAMKLIFQWGVDAFPFREQDGIDLALKWKWFWDVLRKVAPGLRVEGDRYIFIYGGTSSKWIQDFTFELEKAKRNENIKRADVIIEYHQLGKDDPNSIPSFWIGIERKRQNKKHQAAVDCEIQGIVQSLFCLKHDPQGWAILSKGSSIKVLGHGEPMYQTLAEFQSWKDKVLVKEGFDVAFKEYYDTKVKEISGRQPCSYINVDNCTSSVIATITCPNPTCGRVMEVTSVNYKCCHRDEANGSFC